MSLFNFEKGRRVEADGEIIYEIELENSPLGIALAVIERSREHFHKKMTEYYYVIEGKGNAYLNGKKLEIKKGDLLVIPPLTRHYVEKRGKEKVKILVISFPPWSPTDHYMV